MGKICDAIVKIYGFESHLLDFLGQVAFSIEIQYVTENAPVAILFRRFHKRGILRIKRVDRIFFYDIAPRRAVYQNASQE